MFRQATAKSLLHFFSKYFLTMQFFRRWLLYLSPLLCVALLILALWLSRQAEPTPLQTAMPVEQQLHLLCDELLLDPLHALLEAFQRRRAVQVEITAKPATQEFTSLLASHPKADLLLTIENLSSLPAADFNLPAAVIIAQVQPVILATGGTAAKLNSWGDLRKPRLALPENQLSALGLRASSLLSAHHFPWSEARAQAVFRSDDGETLARAVALGRAEAAILWLPNAMQFATVATIVKLPIADQHWAKVAMVTLNAPAEKPELTELSKFLQGAWAKETFMLYGYEVP